MRDAARIGVAGEAHRIVGRARTMLEFMSTARAAGPAAGAAGGAAAHLLGGQRRGHPPLLHRAGPAGVGAGGGRVTPQTQTQARRRRRRGPAAHRWRLQVVHRTRFHYTGPVRSSYNEARLTPESSNRQTTLRSQVEIEPAATAYAYRDYWGSTVTAFDLHSPHAELVVTGTSIVEAGPDLAGHDRVGLERAGRPRGARAVRRAARPRPRSPPWTTRWWPRRRDAVGDAKPHEAGRAGLPVRRRPHGVPVGLDEREDQRDAGVDEGQGRLPGHLARHRRPAARARAARPLRLRLPAPEAEGGDRRAGHRGEPRLGRVVGRRLERLRPDQLRGRSAPGTSPSAGAATTATSRRSRACSPGPRARATR